MALRSLLLTCWILAASGAVQAAAPPTSEDLKSQQALLARCEIPLTQLQPLALETAIVAGGQPRAVICHADDPAWREAALIVRRAIADATGVELELKTDAQLTPEQFAATNAILLGHLDNHRWVARLYHNFFVCLDTGFTGRAGYEIRSAHDPFGTGHNYLLCGGSFAEGTRLAAAKLAALVHEKGRPGQLALGRLLELKFDPHERAEPLHKPLDASQRDALIAAGRGLLFSPGQGRAGIAYLLSHGIAYHRSGDPLEGEVYRAMMLALLEYYRTDATINGGGMRRYDNDFRDAWTFEVAILWDLIEESGLFSAQERLDLTNLLVRLGWECVLYQGWDRPAAIRGWAVNRELAHNHQTFPALGVLFTGNYLKRHYHVGYVDDWLTVGHGVFRAQRHCSKPQEDAAGYQWLPIIHTMIYSLAEGDLAFFTEGHARQSARVALMVMDNAGYEAAFGDASALKSASGVGATLQMTGWYYKDPALAWGARLAGRDHWFPLGQSYAAALTLQPPQDHVGVTVAPIPPPSYEHLQRHPRYGAGPNLPLEQTFDKLSFRGGWQRDDEYLLLDGFGRGNHMHFDANAIISYAAGGEPLLVDAEYIKNTPKYHNSLLIVRDGQADYVPAVTGLGRADGLDAIGYSRTWLTGYNGAQWTRALVWRRNDYLLFSDEVRASKAGDFTLRCCWRPWGQASLAGQVLSVEHPPLRLTLLNADGAPARLETMRVDAGLPISRLSQQVSLPLKPGEGYRFVNLIHAEPSEHARPVAIRQLRDGLALVERPEGRDLVALGPAVSSIAGLKTDAEMVLLGRDLLVAAGCKRLAIGQHTLAADGPIALQVCPKTGRALVLAAAPTKLQLGTQPDGRAETTISLAAGRNEVRLDGFALDPAAVEAIAQSSAAVVRPTAPGPKGPAAELILPPAWQYQGLPRLPEKLRVASVQSSAPHAGRYGPIEKLIDGRAGSSTDSVMWAAGVSPVITAELEQPAEITSVRLHEWHLGSGHEIGDHKLELSSDGFQHDVRKVPAPFQSAGERTSGTNVSTLMEIPVQQPARQLRLTLTPAAKKAAVYLAEMEVYGATPGAAPPITAWASGDLAGDGHPAIVAAAAGQIQAIARGGKALWTYANEKHAAVQALCCMDLDGDGKAEVVYGDEAGHLGVLSGDGQPRWAAELPRFRGITSSVRTIFPADVNGDGRPEIACGCASWQYFAFDAAGKMLWKNVIYAHSATVGLAADFRGDGKQEVAAGNAYYQLNLIRADGKRRWAAGPLGPEVTALAAADLGGDHFPKVVAGVDSGELSCFNRDGKEQWRANLGDRVTAIVPVVLHGDGLPALVCAAESGHVFALKADGSLLWRCALPDGAAGLAVLPGSHGPRLAVAAGDAGLIVVDAAGRVIAHGAAAGRAAAVLALGNQAVLITDRGTLHAFETP